MSVNSNTSTRLWWLASYPKSGNTWLRAFLLNYLSASDKPVDINNMAKTPILGDKLFFLDNTGIDPGILTREELNYSMAGAVRRAVLNSRETDFFIKVHDAYQSMENNTSIIPLDVTSGVIYLVRNPFDIAVSFSNHLQKPIPATIEKMSDENYTISKTSPSVPQFEQRLSSWSSHVQSWKNCPCPRLIIRYEDMIAQPGVFFKRVLQFTGQEFNRQRFDRAMECSSFDQLKTQEKQKGFLEKPEGMPAFFSRGQAGGYLEALTRDDISKLIKHHGATMKEFHYLDHNDNNTV